MKEWKRGELQRPFKIKVRDENDFPIAAVLTKLPASGPDAGLDETVPWPEGEDNLNLILAAPRMKRALEEIVELVKTASPSATMGRIIIEACAALEETK